MRVAGDEGANLTNCALKVGELEDCLNALGGSHCGLREYDPDLDPLCEPVLACSVSYGSRG